MTRHCDGGGGGGAAVGGGGGAGGATAWAAGVGLGCSANGSRFAGSTTNGSKLEGNGVAAACATVLPPSDGASLRASGATTSQRRAGQSKAAALATNTPPKVHHNPARMTACYRGTEAATLGKGAPHTDRFAVTRTNVPPGSACHCMRVTVAVGRRDNTAPVAALVEE
jgi:hypothetical protein